MDAELDRGKMTVEEAGRRGGSKGSARIRKLEEEKLEE
jgi:hypothetical protein